MAPSSNQFSKSGYSKILVNAGGGSENPSHPKPVYENFLVGAERKMEQNLNEELSKLDVGRMIQHDVLRYQNGDGLFELMEGRRSFETDL